MNVDDLNKLLDEYTELHGLKKWQANSNADKYLQLTSAELRAMSAEECGETAYCLSQYSMYLQREVNRESAVVNWATKNIDAMLASKLEGYGSKYTTSDNRKAMAIADNDVATTLYKIKTYAENRMISLQYLPGRVDSVVKTLLELQQTKRKQKDV